MLAKFNERLRRDERGFTLIELLIVIVIIGILLAVAVPAYLGFKDKANQRAAEANVRAAIPAAEAYFSEKGSYTSMTEAELKKFDQAIKIDGDPVISDSGATYCLDADVGGKKAKVTRGKTPVSNGDVVEGSCA